MAMSQSMSKQNRLEKGKNFRKALRVSCVSEVLNYSSVSGKFVDSAWVSGFPDGCVVVI